MHKINQDKHRCSEFKAMEAGHRDAECGSWGRTLVGPLSLTGVHIASVIASWKTDTEGYFGSFS